MSTIKARATRSGGWWAVEFDSPAGARVTQARRLDQVEEMVRDICDMDGVDVTSVEVDGILSADDRPLVDDYKRLAADATAAVEAAAQASRAAVTALREEGLSVRDVASLMGISPQRVSQLAG